MDKVLCFMTMIVPILRILFHCYRHKVICPCSTLSKKTIKNYYKFLAKNSKDRFTGMNMKQKVRIKIRPKSTNILSNQTL